MKKISILTVVKNNQEFIEDCILSILSQNYPFIEYIVVDGQSTDGTLAILEKYKSKIHVLISEQDLGIYDALNKGIRQATGEIIGILHSDDQFYNSEVIRNVMHAFENNRVEGVYGNLLIVDRWDTAIIKRYWRSGLFSLNKMNWGWMPPHVCLFLRKDCFYRFGFYKEKYRISGDYELILRFLLIHQIRLAYIDKIFVRMRSGGLGSKSWTSRALANLEDRKAWSDNGLKHSLLPICIKPIRKIVQFFPKLLWMKE